MGATRSDQIDHLAPMHERITLEPSVATGNSWPRAGEGGARLHPAAVKPIRMTAPHDRGRREQTLC